MPTSTVENYLKAILVRSSDAELGRLDGLDRRGAWRDAGHDHDHGEVAGRPRGLLEHQPREGVRLTPEGRAHALAVVRKHRLVETFLVQVLKMDWKEVHEDAEALEHAISDRVLLRIDALLGHPASDPHGDPIPSAQVARWSTAAAASRLPTARCRRRSGWSASWTRARPSWSSSRGPGSSRGSKVRVRERDRASGVVQCELRKGRATLGLPEAAKIAVEAA